MSDIVIVSSVRTPMGGFQGSLSSVPAVDLGAVAIREAVARAGIQPGDVEEVIMGCVLPAGLKQGPARQAALNAGLPAAAGCTTINKLCGSGMKAVMQAHDALKAGSNSIMVAGGMESMSNAPYLMTKARAGLRMGHGEIKDHMFFDGLEDARTDPIHENRSGHWTWLQPRRPNRQPEQSSIAALQNFRSQTALQIVCLRNRAR